MADTTFIPGETHIDADWAQDVNDVAYITVPANTADIATNTSDILDNAARFSSYFKILTVLVVSINSGGLGYTAGNTVLLDTGIAKIKAQFLVTTVDGSGAVTGLQLIAGGEYLVFDITNVVPCTGGDGTGCLVDIVVTT